MNTQSALSTRDLARLLNVDPRTIQRYVKAGTIPAPIPLGTRTRRWPVAVIEQFMATGLPLPMTQTQGGGEHV